MQTLPLTVPDVVCMLDVDPGAAETTTDLETLEQDVFHILIETLGSNPDDPNRGVGVEELLSGKLDDVQKLGPRCEQQLLEDDRIDTCKATLTEQSDGSFLLHLTIGVDGQVLGLSYAYSATAGLTPLPTAA